ncbi:hypothetical protein DXG01_004626 [Tephrocybe rancida]|nr:hypothetical protein DXG01_004626 [Tephrocybe rancida]
MITLDCLLCKMSEREPLLWNAGPSSRRQSSPTCAPEAGPIAKGGFTTKAWIVLWIATLFLAGFLSERAGHINERTIESTERTLLRKQWDAECTNHTLQIERFKTEEKDLRAQKREMIADYTQQERDLVVKIRGMVLDYTQEEERWQGKMEWYKRQERGLLRRQEEMEDTYRRREHAWQAKIERFKEEWQRMVDAEIRERERARLYWGDIQGAEHCIANGRKKYSARLANLTPSIDGMEACKATPITLNGVTYRQPISCENTVGRYLSNAVAHNLTCPVQGGVHGIRGHWIADNEGACAAYWEFVKPKVRAFFLAQLFYITALVSLRIVRLQIPVIV